MGNMFFVSEFRWSGLKDTAKASLAVPWPLRQAQQSFA